MGQILHWRKFENRLQEDYLILFDGFSIYTLALQVFPKNPFVYKDFEPVKGYDPFASNLQDLRSTD
jgi:hypothetical protein